MAAILDLGHSPTLKPLFKCCEKLHVYIRQIRQHFRLGGGDIQNVLRTILVCCSIMIVCKFHSILLNSDAHDEVGSTCIISHIDKPKLHDVTSRPRRHVESDKWDDSNHWQNISV